MSVTMCVLLYLVAVPVRMLLLYLWHRAARQEKASHFKSKRAPKDEPIDGLVNEREGVSTELRENGV